jgi:hypothetical protein
LYLLNAHASGNKQHPKDGLLKRRKIADGWTLKVENKGLWSKRTPAHKSSWRGKKLVVVLA